MNEEFSEKIFPVLRFLRFYHRHEVNGLQHIPLKGPVIIACTHSFATYDMLLLMDVVLKKTGRWPRALIDRLFYRIPGVGNIMERLGCIVGDPNNAKSVLSNGDLLYIAPGGMEEALRSSSERYQIRWQNRRGFARLAIETGAPIILAACPKADDIYNVSHLSLTNWAYQRFRIPLALVSGIGKTILPKPSKLTHYLSQPYYPPCTSTDISDQMVEKFHCELIQAMRSLLDRTLHDAESRQNATSLELNNGNPTFKHLQ